MFWNQKTSKEVNEQVAKMAELELLSRPSSPRCLSSSFPRQSGHLRQRAVSQDRGFWT